MTNPHREPPNVGMSTFLVHGRYLTQKWDYNHNTVPPMSSSVTYRLDSAQRGGEGFTVYGRARDPDVAPVYIYDRLDEPTRAMLEEELARAEGGEMCVTFSTGMAAISGVLGILTRPGDHIVAFRTIYGCTHSLLSNWYPRYDISTSFVDFIDLATVKAAIQDNTRVIYFESPANPTMDLVDMRGLVEIVNEINATREPEQQIKTVVDNTFATPFCQRPIEWGIDFVVHSLTKNIGGFGTDMGGAAIGPKSLEGELMMYRKDFGGALAAKAAWPILVYGLPTLSIRVQRQIHTAIRIAEFLELHPKVARVAYPGLESFPQRNIALRQMRDLSGNFSPGTLIYFEVKESQPNGMEATSKLIDWIANNSYCITLAVSLGNIRTLIESPYLMTHAPIPESERLAGHINPNGVRLSIGIEKPDDIIRDLRAALENA